MYRRKYGILVFILLLTILALPILSACKKAPLAVFNASVVSGEAPLLVSFTNTSENANQFEWDFGDGERTTTSSISESVNHEYTIAGQYTAKLTASNTDDPSETSVTEISLTVTHGALAEVNVMPESATLDIGGTEEFTVECADTYGNTIDDYQLSWSVDAQAGSISIGVFTAGTKAGVFNEAVTATVTSGSNTTIVSASVTVNPGPLHVVSIVPIEVGAGEEQQLDSIVTDEYGNSIPGLVATWSLLDESAGALTGNGLLTAAKLAGSYLESAMVGVTQGETTIQATGDIVVVPGPLEQVGLAPETIDLGIEMTQQMVAAGADQYGNRISGLTYIWNVEPNAGTITEDGLLTAGSDPGEYKDAITVEVVQDTISRTASGNVNVVSDRILFLSNRDDEESFSFNMFVMDIDGSNQERLLEFEDGYAAISSCSPDGRRILFHDYDNINISNIDGTWLSVFLAGSLVGEPCWSPDGTKIAFQSWEYDPAEICVMDIDSGNITRLTDNDDYDDYPRWSPDGTKIVFISDRDGNNEIYVMNPDGTDQQRITNRPTMELFPQWSPDGEEIIFQSHEISSQDWGIYIMNADGSDVRALRSSVNTGSNLPGWSPDGTKIVFNSNKVNDDAEIYVMNRDGSDVVQLTDNTAEDLIPVWLPRMRGVTVTEESVVIPDISFDLPVMDAETITEIYRDAIVKIETDLGSGSGFIIDPDGIIMTNNHVISDADEITVYLNDGSSYTATVEGRDLVHDIAVLKIEAEDLEYLEMVGLGSVNLGQQVIVMGYPLDKENISVTSGLVSTTEYDIGRNITWVQTDSAVNPGNSGGPMLNMKGQVIGMVSAKLVGLSVEGVGFAISTNTIRTFLSRLLDGETIDSFE